MINVLMDIHLVEARIEATGYRNVDTARADYKKLENEVFQKYQIDTARYQKSFLYYTENINLMSDIYNCIRDSFKLKDSLMKAEPREARPADKNASGKNQKNSEKPKINRKSNSNPPLKVKN